MQPSLHEVQEQFEIPIRKAWFLVVQRACLNLRTSVSNAGSIYQMAAKTKIIIANPAVPVIEKWLQWGAHEIEPNANENQ